MSKRTIIKIHDPNHPMKGAIAFVTGTDDNHWLIDHPTLPDYQKRIPVEYAEIIDSPIKEPEATANLTIAFGKQNAGNPNKRETHSPKFLKMI